MTAACFGLGGPPRLGLSIRSAEGSEHPRPRATSAFVELAMTCPGLYYFATSWLPDAELGTWQNTHFEGLLRASCN